MSVRFVIGRAGSGKTRRCFDSIVAKLRADPLGEPIWWIVPKQQTFTAQRELTCASGLNGFCRARVVSFELLGREIVSECGGGVIPEITDLGRQMMVGHLLRQHQGELKYYASAAHQIGLAAELDATFSELERFGRTDQDLSDLLQKLNSSPDSSSLAAKMTDLRLLYEKYILFLGQDRLDPHRRLQQVLSCIENSSQLKSATVFVDGFLEFTDNERKMLVSMAKISREMEITLLLDPDSDVIKDVHRLPDELSLFHRTEETYRRTWFAFNEAGVAPQPPLLLTKVSRFESPSLRNVEQHLFSRRPVVNQTVENIELIEAADRRGEVDAAARKIRELLIGGHRLRDIAVLMRDLGEYHELIDAAFVEHDIPRFFIDRRRTAAHHPLLQFTRAVFQIALHNWPREAVMTLIKTSLANMSPDDADELENYVILHRIRGGAWADENNWNYRRKPKHEDDDDLPPPQRIQLEKIDALRRGISDRIRPLIALLKNRSELTAKQIVLELFKLYERFDIRKTMQAWIKASPVEQAEEHQQVWAELTALLDQITDVLGDEPIAAANFVEVLETGLEQFDLAITPPTVDQVLIGAVDRTRSPRAKAVILLGMNDNQFPRVPREGSILSDGERRTLSNNKLDLDPDTQRSLLDEQLLGYIALTRASQSLCLVRATADEELRPQSPSPFWIKLRQQFPSLAPSVAPQHPTGTPRQLVTALTHWVRHGAAIKPAEPWAALYQWLATYENHDDPISLMRCRAWRALSYVNDAKLSDDAAKQLFRPPLSASVSRIETFAACPFRHFARYGLKLTEREDEDVTAIDLGNVCHGILEQIVRQMLKGKTGWEMQDESVIRELSNEIGQQLRGELLLSNARNQYILQRIEKTIAQVVAAQSAASKRGKFVPWKAELKFGLGPDSLPPLILKTPKGNVIRLQGRIDRVDLIEDEAAFAVIDYKLSGQSLALDWVYHGLSLQLLVYLVVLQNHAAKLGKQKLTPAAAFYVKLLRGLDSVKHPDEAILPDDPLFDLQTKPRGIMDVTHLRALDNETENGWSQVVQVHRKKDGQLGFRSSSDAATSDEFAAMLKLVEKKLGELADQIIAGDVEVRPYRIGSSSPCQSCEYRSVCRFDPALNHYRKLEPIKREDVLARAIEEAS